VSAEAERITALLAELDRVAAERDQLGRAWHARLNEVVAERDRLQAELEAIGSVGLTEPQDRAVAAVLWGTEVTAERAAPECVLCRVDRHLRGTPPLGPPVSTIEIPGVFGLQPVCAAHLAAWEALDDPGD
jgi:hypothetical protein